MNRTWLYSALSLTLAIGLVPATASAKDHDRDRHEHRERVVQHESVRDHDRARWEREHRERQRAESRREHHEREAMHRWDRDHHRRPTYVRDEHHRPNGWGYGHKTGWHNGNVPPRHTRTYDRNHHYDRHRVATRQPDPSIVPNRPTRGGYSNQQVEARVPRTNERTGPVVR